MIQHLEIVTSDNGGRTLLRKDLNETYHSVKGAIEESLHVFISKGLQHLIQTTQKEQFNILEIGFGTGLNAMLTFLETEKKDIRITYHALETVALEYDLVKQLEYQDHWGGYEEIFRQMHEVVWDEPQTLQPKFLLHKHLIPVQSFQSNTKFDLVYFDAFAPGKQPEMWSAEIFTKLYGMMNQGGVLVTYSAKGDVRRALLQCGFTVEKPEGPPGKRHMLRATKTSAS